MKRICQLLRIAAGVLLITAGLTLTTGCANRISTTPPSAAQAAAIGIDDFVALTSAAQDAETEMYHQSTVDLETHRSITKIFQRVGNDEVAINSAMKAGTTPAVLSVRIQALSDEINKDLANGVLGVKNPDSKAKLQALVKVLGNTASLLAQKYQTIPAVPGGQ